MVELNAVEALRTWESASACLVGSPLAWEREGLDWPNRDTSRFVEAAGMRWHVQRFGRGPAVLLVHGTGGATHSWRTLAPTLAKRFEIIALDLPGHGFSDMPTGRAWSLPRMAGALRALLDALDVRPALVVGHSAGAAILCRMCLDGQIEPRGLVSLNGALLPLRGVPPVFTQIARLMTWNPLIPRLLARRAHDPAVVARLLRGTGSSLDARGLELYGRLMQNPRHVAAALTMMAHWDLRPLARELPRLIPPLLLVVGDRDRYIPVSEASRICSLLPTAELVQLPDLGHLAHEEQPQEIAALVSRFARSAGVRSGGRVRR